MFMHECVARHYKVPQLTPTAGAVSSDLPFLNLNTSVLETKQQQRSVAVLHALCLAGAEQPTWESHYNRLAAGRRLDEEFDFVDRVANNARWLRQGYLDYQTAYYNMMRENASCYSINGQKRWALPLTPINGKWVEIETSQTTHLYEEDVTLKDVQSEHVKMRKQIDKMRSAILTYGERLGSDHLSKALAIMG
jgi:hypothetical protein